MPEPEPAPTAELWQRPATAPTAELWQPARLVDEGRRPAGQSLLVASWAATPRPDAPWSPLQEARPGAKPLAKMKRRGITMMPLGSKRARA